MSLKYSFIGGTRDDTVAASVYSSAPTQQQSSNNTSSSTHDNRFFPATYPMVTGNLPQYGHAIRKKANESVEDIVGRREELRKTPIQKPPPSRTCSFVGGVCEDDDYTMESDSFDKSTASIVDRIYNSVSNYYDNFTMTKTANIDNFSVYKAIVECLLCDGVRFIVAIVKNNNNHVSPIGSTEQLSTLKWVSFQTRFAPDDNGEFSNYNITPQPHNYPDDNDVLNETIMKNYNVSDDGKNTYNCNTLPLIVEILKSKEDENISDNGTILGALQLYSTVLILK